MSKVLYQKCLLQVVCSHAHTIVFAPQCETWKRFSDFQLLWRQLEVLHSQSHSFVPLPALVKAKYFGEPSNTAVSVSHVHC